MENNFASSVNIWMYLSTVAMKIHNTDILLFKILDEV